MMEGIGMVIIGRNEGERLRRCLQSVAGSGVPIVYVDSASSDGSAEMARSMGVSVIEVDASSPLSAARARNEGFKKLLEENAKVQYVQFVDGDCEMAGGWLARAAATLEARSDVAAVAGRLREKSPEQSIYNRLCDMEWDAGAASALTGGPSSAHGCPNSAGGGTGGTTWEVASCGGIAMHRVAALREAGGFDPTIAAGEEPELCLRLRKKGWKVLRLADEMALHDSAMLRFGQWWRRLVRNGYGCLDVTSRLGTEGRALFGHEVRSARIWGLAWPAMLVGGVVVAAIFGGKWWALIVTAAMLGIWFLELAKIAWGVRRRAGGMGLALSYALFMMIGKWPQIVGHLRLVRNRLSGRNPALLPYNKGSSARCNRPDSPALALRANHG